MDDQHEPLISKSPRRIAVGSAIAVFAAILLTGVVRTSHAQFGLPAVPGIPGAGALAGAAGGLGGLGGASAAPQTLGRFLGFKGGQRLRNLRDALVNRRGNFPGLEKKPRIKSLTDPDNMKSDNPAIKKAAETKAAADEAPQKVKALKYLATVGCDKCNPGVKEALMAALDDCTEEVRFEGAKALRQVAGDKCNACRKTCCDKQLTDKLFDVAYGREEDCCYKESSARVRKMARQALCACATPGTGSTPPPATEGPTVDPNEVKPEDVSKAGTLTQTSAAVADPKQLAAEIQARQTTASKQIMSALFAPPGVSAARHVHDGHESVVSTPIRSISPRERQMAMKAQAERPTTSRFQPQGGVQQAVVQEPVIAKQPAGAAPPVAQSNISAAPATADASKPTQAIPTAQPVSPVQPAVVHDSHAGVAHAENTANQNPSQAQPSSHVQQTAGPWTSAAERRFDAETSRQGRPEDYDPTDPNRVPGGRLNKLTRPLNNLIKSQTQLPDEEFFMPYQTPGMRARSAEGQPQAQPQPRPQPPVAAPTPAPPQETVRKGPRAKPQPTPAHVDPPAITRKAPPKYVEPEAELEPEEEAPSPGEVSKWLAGAKKSGGPIDKNAEGSKLTGRLKLFGSGSVPAEESPTGHDVRDLAEVLPKSAVPTSPSLANDGPDLEAPSPIVRRVPAPQPRPEESPLPAAPNTTKQPDPEFAVTRPSAAPKAAPAVEPEPEMTDAPLPGSLPTVQAVPRPATIEPTDRRFDVAAELRPSQRPSMPINTTDEPLSEPQPLAEVAEPELVERPKRMPSLIPRRRPQELEAPLPESIPVAGSPRPIEEPAESPMPEEPAPTTGGKPSRIVLTPFKPDTEEESLPSETKTPAAQVVDNERMPQAPAPKSVVAAESSEPAEVEAPLPSTVSAAAVAGIQHRAQATVAPRSPSREPAAIAPKQVEPQPQEVTPREIVAQEVPPKAEPEETPAPIHLPEGKPRVAGRTGRPMVVLPGKTFRKEFEEGEGTAEVLAPGTPRPLPTGPIQLPGADLNESEPEPIPVAESVAPMPAPAPSPVPSPAKTAKGPIQIPGGDSVPTEPVRIQVPGSQDPSSAPAAGIKKGPKLFPNKGTPMKIPGGDAIPEATEAAEPAEPAATPITVPEFERRKLPPPTDAPAPSPIQLPGTSSTRKAKKAGQSAGEPKPMKLGGMTIFLRDAGEGPVLERQHQQEVAVVPPPLRLTLNPQSASIYEEAAKQAKNPESISLAGYVESTPTILQQSYVVPTEVPVRGRVRSVNAEAGLVELTFAGPRPAMGARISLVRIYPSENVYLGDLEVVELGERVLAKPTAWLPVQRITVGDHVCLEGDALLAPK